MLQYGNERGIDQAIRQLHRNDHVIETIVRGHIACDCAALAINHHMEGINSYFVQHRASQGCFILAIPVTMGKNLGRRMRLKAANAKLNGDVADVVLHKASYCLHFFKLRVFPCRQECDLLFYLGRGFHSSGYQLVLPVSQIAPLREAVCRFSAGRKESDDHLSSYSLPWGHKGFVADTFYVTY